MPPAAPRSLRRARLRRLGTAARSRAAARAAGAVLSERGVLDLDAGDARERREPREDVGELLLERGALHAAPQRARQLAHLLGEPHERPFEAAAAVLGAVERLDPALELGDRHA